MASQYIQIDNTKPLGAAAQQAIAMTQEALEQLNAIRSVLEQVATGSDWPAVELLFGIPTGQGQTFYNLFTGARSAIDVAAVTTLLARCGRG